MLGSADFVSDTVLAMAQRHPLFRDLRGGALVLQNAVDWLAHDNALTAARSKGAPPPIDPLDANARWWVKWGNTVGSALFVLVLGLIAWLVRERRRARLSL